MSKRAFWLATIVTLGVGLATVSACPIHRVVVVKKKAVIVEKVVEVAAIPLAVYVPFAVQVPAYSAGYAPGFVQGQPQGQPQIQAQAQPGGDLAAILAELRRLNGRIDALEGRKPAAKQGTPGPASAVTPVLLAKCASCHDAKVSAKEGNGLSLFADGQALAWTERQKSRAQSQVYSGKMPKGGKVTDEEVGELMAEIDAMK